MTLVADSLGHDTPYKQGVNCLSPLKSVTYCLVEIIGGLQLFRVVLQRLSIPLNYYEISQNNNGHCYQDFIFLLHMHCFENYLLSYKTCFVLNVTSLFWKLLCLDDLIYLISYVLKALSNFTHDSVLKTDRQTDRPTDRPTDQVSPRSDFPSLKNTVSKVELRSLQIICN